jgi:hypothetical protein
MQFWKGNRIDGEFTAEPADVAAQFTEWWQSQSGDYRNGMLLERALRDWLTRQNGLSATWTDESPQGFGAIYATAHDLIWPRRDPGTPAERAAFLATARPTRRGRPAG